MSEVAGWNRRRFLASAGLFSAAAMTGLSACGGGEEGPTSSPGKVPEDLVAEAKKLQNKKMSSLAKLEYFDETNKAFDQTLEVFSKETGIEVTNTHVNVDTGNIIAKQEAAVKAGSVQDIGYFDAGRFISPMHQLELLQDVTDVVEELSEQYGPPPDIAEIQLKYGDKWYGIPFYSTAGGWFLREDWLKDKGIGKADLKVWADARDAALEISDPDQKRYGWGSTVNRSGDANGLIESVVNAYGGALVTDDGKKVVLNSPETIEGVSFLADIYTNPKYKEMLPPGVGSWTDTGNNEAWLAGFTGMTNNSYSVYADSKVSDNPVYDVTLTLPGWRGPATDRIINTAQVFAFVIFKGAKNPEAAKIMAKYLVSGGALLNMVKRSASLVLPAYEKVWQSNPYYLNGDPIFRTTYDLLNAPLPIETSTGYNFPQAPSPGADSALEGYVLTDMMGDIIHKGTAIKDAVETAHQRMVKIFEDLGIKQ